METEIPNWYLWNPGIDKNVCNDIIDIVDKWTPAGIIEKGDYELDKSIRDSSVFFVDRKTHKWVYDLTWEFVNLANMKSRWHYNITEQQNIQLTRYETGNYYGVHRDDGLVIDGMARKLSMTILLNDDFNGGDFEILGSEIQPELKQGSVLCFPSYSFHKVNEVISGTRYSLVSWFIGTPFR